MADNFSRFRVFLSASVPDEERDKKYLTAHLPDHVRKVKSRSGKDYDKLPNAQLQIEEAVICLARAVLANGGQLVFGGHPSISPLISVISEEYIDEDEERGGHAPGLMAMQGDRYDEMQVGVPPVVIYQSRYFEDKIPHETRMMLAQGHAFVRWTPEVKGDLKASLLLMRDAMIASHEIPLDAMVCIGGMEGVEDEADLFVKANKGKPVFLLKSTGGAAALLADDYNNTIPTRQKVVIDADADTQWDEYGLQQHVSYLAWANEIVKRLLVVSDKS